LTINYLKHFWFIPNYDCWEELNNQIHPSTLACTYGGLRSINQFIHDQEIPDICIKIKELILRKGVYKGRITKYFGSTSIDANLLWLIVPFRMFEPTDEITKRTIEDIEKKLYTGGVHRYPEDTYYGGGEWILLTAWLSWYYCQVGELGKARKLLSWIEKQADEDGNLPEQVPNNLNDPDYYPIWIQKWGKIAKPLLWSHAMYLILDKELEEQREYKQDNLER
ncbi:glycoside hydrolase, partial [bacterium]|nr:glycoside hydrolase [bacterium]